MAKRTVGMDIGLQEGIILKSIPDIDEMYSAGSDGRIYSSSTARTNAKKPKPFKLSNVKNDNYYMVSLMENGKKRSYSVHFLICSAFHGKRTDGKPIVRHLDGDWSNNVPNNLVWGSYAENEADKRRHGRVAEGERQGSAKLTEEAVRIIRTSIPYGLWNTADAAKVFNVSPSTIRAIARGRGWEHAK